MKKFSVNFNKKPKYETRKSCEEELKLPEINESLLSVQISSESEGEDTEQLEWNVK